MLGFIFPPENFKSKKKKKNEKMKGLVTAEEEIASILGLQIIGSVQLKSPVDEMK